VAAALPVPRSLAPALATLASLPLLLLAQAAQAVPDEVRYSWVEISFLGQDVGKDGTQIDTALSQQVDLDADNGDGIRFRGMLGPWKNFYLFGEFGSTDIDDSAVITNPQGQFSAGDQFDLTTLRGGVGFRYPLTYTLDIIAEVSYDSLDFDFGSFAGENFDTDDQGIGGTLGVRAIFGKNLELNAHARYTSVGDVDLTARELDDDILFGGGFAFNLIRGLAITGDYETGEIDSFAVGFRLDIFED
jgi:hypothetical protein